MLREGHEQYLLQILKIDKFGNYSVVDPLKVTLPMTGNMDIILSTIGKARGDKRQIITKFLKSSRKIRYPLVRYRNITLSEIPYQP